MNFFVMNAMLI
jgi:Phosphatidyl serine synthase